MASPPSFRPAPPQRPTGDFHGNNAMRFSHPRPRHAQRPSGTMVDSTLNGFYVPGAPPNVKDSDVYQQQYTYPIHLPYGEHIPPGQAPFVPLHGAPVEYPEQYPPQQFEFKYPPQHQFRPPIRPQEEPPSASSKKSHAWSIVDPTTGAALNINNVPPDAGGILPSDIPSSEFAQPTPGPINNEPTRRQHAEPPVVDDKSGTGRRTKKKIINASQPPPKQPEPPSNIVEPRHPLNAGRGQDHIATTDFRGPEIPHTVFRPAHPYGWQNFGHLDYPIPVRGPSMFPHRPPVRPTDERLLSPHPVAARVAYAQQQSPAISPQPTLLNPVGAPLRVLHGGPAVLSVPTMHTTPMHASPMHPSPMHASPIPHVTLPHHSPLVAPPTLTMVPGPMAPSHNSVSAAPATSGFAFVPFITPPQTARKKKIENKSALKVAVEAPSGNPGSLDCRLVSSSSPIVASPPSIVPACAAVPTVAPSVPLQTEESPNLSSQNRRPRKIQNISVVKPSPAPLHPVAVTLPLQPVSKLTAVLTSELPADPLLATSTTVPFAPAPSSPAPTSPVPALSAPSVYVPSAPTPATIAPSASAPSPPLPPAATPLAPAPSTPAASAPAPPIAAPTTRNVYSMSELLSCMPSAESLVPHHHFSSLTTVKRTSDASTPTKKSKLLRSRGDAPLVRDAFAREPSGGMWRTEFSSKPDIRRSYGGNRGPPYGRPEKPKIIARARKQRGDEENTRRDLVALLNKLTVEKFATIARQLATALSDVDNTDSLFQFVKTTFGKAVTEPNFSTMYADVILVLFASSPDLTGPEPKDSDDEIQESPEKKQKERPAGLSTNFRRMFLDRCQSEYERLYEKTSIEFVLKGEATMTPEEREIEIRKRKTRVLGNMRLVAELARRKLISLGVIFPVIEELIRPKGEKNVPEEHHLECICELVSLLGSVFEKKHGLWLDNFFEKLGAFQSQFRKSNLRLFYKVMDLFDLRKNGWCRKLFKDKAKGLSEIQAEHERVEQRGGEIAVAQDGKWEDLSRVQHQPYTEFLKTYQDQHEKRRKEETARKRAAAEAGPLESPPTKPADKLEVENSSDVPLQDVAIELPTKTDSFEDVSGENLSPDLSRVIDCYCEELSTSQFLSDWSNLQLKEDDASLQFVAVTHRMAEDENRRLDYAAVLPMFWRLNLVSLPFFARHFMLRLASLEDVLLDCPWKDMTFADIFVDLCQCFSVADVPCILPESEEVCWNFVKLCLKRLLVEPLAPSKISFGIRLLTHGLSDRGEGGKDKILKKLENIAAEILPGFTISSSDVALALLTPTTNSTLLEQLAGWADDVPENWLPTLGSCFVPLLRLSTPSNGADLAPLLSAAAADGTTNQAALLSAVSDAANSSVLPKGSQLTESLPRLVCSAMNIAPDDLEVSTLLQTFTSSSTDEEND